MQIDKKELSAFPDSKKHYAILDGLRGVAAIMVVAFHVFEANAATRFEQIINHGYLAVDFFYVLSGYVIGYAYDDRWGKMTIGDFFKRRLIRLHPMIIMGMIIGALLFYFGDGAMWPGIHEVPVWKMLMVMIIGFTLIPVPLSLDIRGWGEMHPLDGPGWSLFFEYVGNILYGLFVRKFSTTLLSILVFISGAALIHLAVAGGNGDVIGGWSLEPSQFQIGITRMMYPFFAGLLLSRITKPKSIKNAFLVSAAMVIIILSIPRIGSSESLWMNGIYDSLSIVVFFPIIVYIGASGQIEGKIISKISNFLGNISYPIYITHYPLIYVYTAWVRDNNIPLAKALPYGALVLLTSVAIAHFALKLYDVPIRKWLMAKYITK